MNIPDFLIQLGQAHPEHLSWVENLPQVIDRLKNKWDLRIEEPFTENATCSFVAPCIFKQKEKAVLKIGLPHDEAIHEIDGLQLFNGHPTVYLLKSDKDLNAMLLELCNPGTQLSDMQEEKQDEIITQTLKEIWKAKINWLVFRPLSDMVQKWNQETYDNLDKFPDSGLAKAGCQLKEELIKSTDQNVFLATDLHAGNVLKAEREPWLAIDIKPYYGDRAYDLTQHLLNCKKRLRQSPEETINRLSLLAGVKQERLRQWIFARLASENNGKDQEMALFLHQCFG